MEAAKIIGAVSPSAREVLAVQRTTDQGKGEVVVEALRPFGTTIFTEMTVLANRCGVVNLAQGNLLRSD